MVNSELTRQVYWSPSGGLSEFYQLTIYFWLVLAVIVMGYGVWRHVRFWRMGKPEAVFNKPWERSKFFVRTVLLQSKVLRARRQRDPKPRSMFAAWMHGLIFYGFMGLFFGTTIVGLKDYGIADLYHGWFYAFVTVICEVSGVALAIGLVMGIARRSINKSFKQEAGYTVLYTLLLLLVIQGFILEGQRIAVQMATGESRDALWSFVGYGFSFLLSSDIKTAETVYTSMWYGHMVTNMAFVATIPYSRAMHIVTSILNFYTDRMEPKVLMPKMDFENTEQEYFGPQKITDFAWKDLLMFDSCTECRRCTDICPANAVGKPLDPREVILKLRDSMLAEAHMKEASQESKMLFESGQINHAEIWACTNCGACVDQCPVGIDQMRAIVSLKRYQTLTVAEIPPSAAKAIENIKQHKNPWGITPDDRFKWAEGLDVPVITGDSPEVEWLYYVGCAGSYDSSNQKVARSVVKILKHAGVDFAVLGKAEQCNGEPVKRLGDEYSFSEIAMSNVEQLNALKFKKIVTHCPHCFNTIKNDFKEYGGNYEVHHHTQLLSALYKDGKLKLPGEVRKEVTFHDPCFLGRHNGEYEAPRQLLEGIAGLRLHEMEKSRDTSSCCGMGGGNMWYESEGGTKPIVENRLEHVAATKAKTLVTGCSFCLINFKGAFKNLEATQDLEVMDIAEAIDLALPQDRASL